METVWDILGDYPKETFSGITIMNTFNIMSVTSYVDFLKKILEWRKRFIVGNEGKKCIKFDIPHCTEPAQWTLIGLPDSYDRYFRLITDFMIDNSWETKVKDIQPEDCDANYYYYFTEEEIAAWNRVNSYWNTIKEDRTKLNPPHYLDVVQVDDARRNWFLFIEETDKRRKTDFLTVFPEMEDYYHLCRELESEDARFYNKYVKDLMLAPLECEIHLDDDFFAYHGRLGENLINYRYIKGYPTKIFKDDLLIREF
jgi:hypothetical protein